MLEASDDLTNLSHLNEPAVLQAIKLRYAQKEIYTYSGIVLIATNPFARVDSLYVPGMVQVYAGKHRSSQAPHLFAIAEEAFAEMLRDGRNQTIVVSGESGAGKTVSAKYIMRYFATREPPDQSLNDLFDGVHHISVTACTSGRDYQLHIHSSQDSRR